MKRSVMETKIKEEIVEDPLELENTFHDGNINDKESSKNDPHDLGSIKIEECDLTQLIKEEQEDLHIKQERCIKLEEVYIKQEWENFAEVNDVETGPEYLCYNCDFKTCQKWNLISHIQSHHNTNNLNKSKSSDKPYRCKICKYRSKQKEHLKQHMMVHTDEKPFQCSVCEFRCKGKEYLKRHMMKHKDEKPYQCNVCDYKSKGMVYLHKHMKIHADEKPYQCNICEYKTIYLRNFKSHMMIHTGERPYRCNKCEYGTIYKQQLTKHTKIKHGC